MRSGTFYTYTVYENGDVFSEYGKKIVWQKNHNGYLFTRLRAPRWRTVMHHVCIAAAFYGPKPDGYEVNHINCIRDDNRASNLEYVTRRDNRVYSYSVGARKVDGERNANAILTATQVHEICALLQGREYKSILALSRQLGVPDYALYAIRSRKQWKEISQSYSF